VADQLVRASARNMFQVKSQQAMLKNVEVFEFKRLLQQRSDSLIIERPFVLKSMSLLI
jgi:hypothetical protein